MGFVIDGTAAKTILVRALGPSLQQRDILHVLHDPTIELHGPGDIVLGFNDNWKDSQSAEIQQTGLAPTNDAESAILVTLPPGNYTALTRGANSTRGNGLVEVYAIGQDPAASIVSVSFRGRVLRGDDHVIIAGFMIDTQATEIAVRALGPTLELWSRACVIRSDDQVVRWTRRSNCKQ